MPINKIEQKYINNRKFGLYQLQQNNYLIHLEEIDDALLEALENEDYEEVIIQLDELCYMFVQEEDTKVVLIALELYYTSLITMIIRSMLRKKKVTEYQLSNAASIISIVKQWQEIKDYLYYTPWYVSKIKELFAENEKALDVNSYIYKAILIIKKELFNPDLSTSYVAGKLNISKGYLCYLFKHEYGESLTTMIHKLRLKYVLKDIKDVRLPLVGIMEKYGFKSYPYFSRVFKAHYGVSPSEYRKRNFIMQ